MIITCTFVCVIASQSHILKSKTALEQLFCKCGLSLETGNNLTPLLLLNFKNNNFVIQKLNNCYSELLLL